MGLWKRIICRLFHGRWHRPMNMEMGDYPEGTMGYNNCKKVIWKCYKCSRGFKTKLYLVA